MDVNLNVGLYWLLIYTFVSFTVCTEPTRCHQEHYMPCGDDKTPCQIVLCLVKNNYNVDKINVIKHTENCKSNVGYDGEYVWTTDCCRVVAHVCYSVSDKFDGSIAPDIIHGRRFAPGNGNVFSPIANNSLQTIIEKVTPIVKVEGRNKKSSSVGLYVGAALGIVTMLVVIATVCFVFRKKLKRPILWRKTQNNSREDLSFPVYQSPDSISFPSVRDSTFKLELEKKEESPYLCMNSGLIKETKSDDDCAARTSRSLSDTETDAQNLSYGRGQISSSVGSVYYRDPEIVCNTIPPPAPHNMKRQSHQLKDTNEGVPLYADKQKDELVLGNETENVCEEEVAYLDMRIISEECSREKNQELQDRRQTHDPMPIPQLPQRRSFKSSDNVPSPFTLLREGDDSSSDDSDDYLTPSPDLVTTHLKRSKSARPAQSTHVNPTVNRSSFA